MSCHVMSCHVMSRHVMSCHVTSCHVMSCRVMSCHVVSCRVMSCHVTSCHVMSRHVTSCHVTSCHVTSCRVMSRHIMSCHTIPYSAGQQLRDAQPLSRATDQQRQCYLSVLLTIQNRDFGYYHFEWWLKRRLLKADKGCPIWKPFFRKIGMESPPLQVLLGNMVFKGRQRMRDFKIKTSQKPRLNPAPSSAGEKTGFQRPTRNARFPQSNFAKAAIKTHPFERLLKIRLLKADKECAISKPTYPKVGL